ncbi:hypothetical protein SEA_ANIMUS_66 [Streptomyces phage Animus]|nr:hypothetical protein SEA_ANIMUS_66 [Streptomyces phage Animus]
MKLTAKILAFVVALGVLGGLANRNEAEAAPSPKPLPISSKVKFSKLPPAVYVAPFGKLPTRPCTEDDTTSRNCFWDAARQGNGKGYSYWVDAKGRLTYLDPKLNNETKRKLFALGKQAAGWEHWGVVWGHQLCYAKVGDTSLIHCYDGFRETS